MPGLSAPSAKILTFRLNNGFCICFGQRLIFVQFAPSLIAPFLFEVEYYIGGLTQALNPVMWGHPQFFCVVVFNEDGRASRRMAAIDVAPAVADHEAARQVQTQVPRGPQEQAGTGLAELGRRILAT